MRKALSIAARILCIVFTVLLLGRLLRSQDGTFLKQILLCLHSPAGVTALFLYLMVELLGALRWNILLTPPRLRFSFWQAFRLTMAGNFFSLVIPGGLSGDVIKVGSAAAAYPGRTTELALVDLLDRFFGFVGLCGASAISLALLAPAMLSRRDLAPGCARILLFGTVITVVGLSLSCFGWFLLCRGKNAAHESLSETHPPSQKQHFPRRMVSRFCAALSLYRDAPAAILKAFAISIVIHLMMGLEFYLLGKALHESVMGLGEYLLATQLADVTAVLPITPGGLGVRDTMAQLLFQEFGAAPANVATAIPLIYSAILLFWGIAGAILYVAFPAAKPFSSTCHSPNTNP